MRERQVHGERDAEMRSGALLAAGFVGIAVVFAVWWFGPGLFAGAPSIDGRVVEATVVESAPCSEPNATAVVEFSAGADRREAPLDACGHGEDERIDIAVPESGEKVYSADVAKQYHDWYRPVGLVLVALSCLGGAVYASVITRAGGRVT
ncbi:hypothetical protein [Haloechinothrix aidingensis]